MAFLSTTFRWRSTHDVSHSTLQREDGAYLSLALGTGNLISATHIFDAIDVCGNKNQIALNTIMSAQESAIHLDDTCTNSGNNNQVLANNINETCVGVRAAPRPLGNKVNANFIFNAVDTSASGYSASCTPPQSPDTNSVGAGLAMAAISRASSSASHSKVVPLR